LEKIENMKNKIMVLSAVFLMGIASISCSMFAHATKPTQEVEPYPLVTPSTEPTQEGDLNVWVTPDSPGPVEFEPEALPAAQMGVMYEAEIHITENHTPVGGFSISNGTLPAGLEFVKDDNEDFAKISGIPKETGTFAFTVSVWCYGTMAAGQTGEKEYGIVVKK
jgi:hypothetical protein